MKFEQTLNFICSLIVLLFLGLIAYSGLAASLSLPCPEFIADFGVFYGIFHLFSWTTVLTTLPLVLCAFYASFHFTEKSFKILFWCLEIAFLAVIILCGIKVI